MTLLATLVGASQRVAAASGRLAKLRELAACLQAVDAVDIEIAVAYLSGELPQGRIGIGYAALSAAAGVAPAPHSNPEDDAAPLTLVEVDAALSALAQIGGSGSTARRAAALGSMFSKASAAERSFLLRLLAGELRQGALEGVMLEAIAVAANVPADAVRRAAMYSKSMGLTARAAMLEGLPGLAGFRLELFAPVAPMLAQTATDVAEALEELGGEAAFEWKMDGARIQVHTDGGEVRVYTRGMNEISAAVPEIVAAVRSFGAQAAILDGEAIAFDTAGRPHPFQVTMRRFGRKLNVEALRATLPIRAYYFDCLRAGEHSLAELPARVRGEALARMVPESMRVPRLVTADRAAAEAFYDAAIAAGHEGLMAKALAAPYEAGNRGAGWLKIKRAHTLDLVVLAAEWGHGRRTGKLSNLHLGALDPSSGAYVMLGKTFKGLTDAMLDWQTHELLARETRREGGTVYVRAELVVAIAFSDLQVSPRYPAGMALRLARVKRYRDDKGPEAADTLDSVRRIFRAQSGAP